ncbi:hypothetical protein KBTX_00490 [wastewater metagenome]|uniref:Uncharacterized protein n=2 Tax=unclassified sequences TaxID=12908 RepID=A0A5B8R6B9_9ZZZZ|nr:hypothetical protein KBTEX_00490 [uncultured organism]
MENCPPVSSETRSTKRFSNSYGVVPASHSACMRHDTFGWSWATLIAGRPRVDAAAPVATPAFRKERRLNLRSVIFSLLRFARGLRGLGVHVFALDSDTDMD